MDSSRPDHPKPSEGVSRRGLIKGLLQRPSHLSDPDLTFGRRSLEIALSESIEPTLRLRIETSMRSVLDQSLSRRQMLRASVGAVAEGLLYKQEVVAGSSQEKFNEQEIDLLTTFGSEQPLTETSLPKLFDHLNGLDTEIDQDTYYSTIFVTKEIYDDFLRDNNTDFSTYVRMNEAVMNVLFEAKDNPARLKIRRLIVLDDSFQGKFDQQVYDRYRFSERLHDTDGAWMFDGATSSDGVPCFANFCTDGKKVATDNHFLHELGHAVFKLADQYKIPCLKGNLLSGSTEIFSLPPELSGVPEEWEEYWSSNRGDLGGSLMDNNSLDIKEYINLQLKRRAAAEDVHDLSKTHQEISGLPHEIPATTLIHLGDQFQAAKVEVYHSVVLPSAEENVINRSLEHVRSVNVLSDGTLVLDSAGLFKVKPDGCVDQRDSVLFLKVTTPDGEEFYRWMDIRDFSIARWNGYEQEANMHLQLASEDDKQREFDWTIHYETPEGTEWSATRSERELNPQVIDGIETYGINAVFSSEDLHKLVVKLNSETKEMEDDTYYGTVLVPESFYLPFALYNPESIQQFFSRHAEAMNLMLKDANAQSKFVLRRIIVVEEEEGINPLIAYRPSEEENLLDSDGYAYVAYGNSYNLVEQPAYNPYWNVDAAMVRDLAQDIVHLQDQRILSIPSPNPLIPVDVIRDIPDQFLVYDAGKRDIANDIMSTDNLRFGTYAALSLRERIKQGTVHDKVEQMMLLAEGYPHEAPLNPVLELGAQFKNSRAFLISVENGPERDNPYPIGKIIDFQADNNGNVTIDTGLPLQEFEKGKVYSSSARILLKVIDGEGNIFVRWMDVRDFNIASWVGGEKAHMSVPLTAITGDPQKMYDPISYS